MLELIEAHPLVTTLVGVLAAAALSVIGHFLKKALNSDEPTKKQTISSSSAGRDIQQAEVIINNSSIKNTLHERNSGEQMKLAPAISRIPPIRNGGRFEGENASIQIRFGSETDLELVDAHLERDSYKIHCNPRDTKLAGGNTWNSFHFPSAKLSYVPDQMVILKIRVCDHSDRCSELTHKLQMKQFAHKDYEGVISGRWEIHPIGIFKISHKSGLSEGVIPLDQKISNVIEDWEEWNANENRRVSERLTAALEDIRSRGMQLTDGPYRQKADEIMQDHQRNTDHQKKIFRRELEAMGCEKDLIPKILK